MAYGLRKALGIAGCVIAACGSDASALESNVVRVTARPLRYAFGGAEVSQRDAYGPGTEMLSGVWQSQGYGLIADFTHAEPRLYELSAAACLPSVLPADRETVRFAVRAKKLSAQFAGDAAPVTFTPLASLPQACTRAHDASPPAVLDALCANLSEQYAFSSLRHVDFVELCGQARATLSTDATEEQLWQTLADLLDHTQDGHVNLFAFEPGTTQFDMAHVSMAHNAGALPRLVQELHAEFLAQSQIAEEGEFQAAALEQLRAMPESYLEAHRASAAEGVIRWGRVRGEAVGYLAIDAMELSSDSLTAQQQVAVFSAALDEALVDLRGQPALIVDLRLNGGGYDPVALAIASRFARASGIAFTVQARAGDALTEAVAVRVAPATRPYRGRLALLTSALTASAAEVFVLSLLDRPKTSRVGEATAGIFSDMWPRALPNGWAITLSNEVYRAPDGRVFEGTGIAPDSPADCFSVADRTSGQDTALEAALELLRAQ